MNQCPLCKGLKIDGTTTFTVDLIQSLVVVRDVPAKVCKQCNEIWIDDKIAEKLEKITENIRKHPKQIEVVYFRDAA